MTEYLSLDEIKQEELKILIYFDKFCKEHNLQYSLAGGTLLGAVRHKGFIPWDDDIDVCMPRPDYERFLKIFQKDGIFEIEAYGRQTIENSPYIKLIRNDIDVSDRTFEGTKNLWVDIFPVDGLLSGDISKLYRNVSYLRRLLAMVTAGEYSSSSRLKNFFKSLVKPILKALKVDFIAAQVLGKIVRKVRFGETKYVGVLAWGLYGTGERISYKGYNHLVPLEFEGEFFPVMSNYDEYLSGIYGDYMQLPPVAKRQSHHVKAWRK